MEKLQYNRLLLLLKRQVLAFCQTSFAYPMAFSERMDNKQRDKAMKTCVPLEVIILITALALLTRFQLANILLMRNFLCFFSTICYLFVLQHL